MNKLLNNLLFLTKGENPFSLPSKLESDDPRILTCAHPWVTELPAKADVGVEKQVSCHGRPTDAAHGVQAVSELL